MKDRTEGWYWVRHYPGDEWHPEEWTGSRWYSFGSEEGVTDGAETEVGPRILPPEEEK